MFATPGQRKGAIVMLDFDLVAFIERDQQKRFGARVGGCAAEHARWRGPIDTTNPKIDRDWESPRPVKEHPRWTNPAHW